MIIKNYKLLIIFLLIFTGCDNKNIEEQVQVKVNDNKNIEETIKDIDNNYNPYQIISSSVISGLKVVCGDLEFITNLEVPIECKTYPIFVYLGDYEIGNIGKETIDSSIFIQDLINVPRGALMHPKLTKISLILDSFDKDSNIKNGIDLKEEYIIKLSDYLNEFTSVEDYTVLEINDFLIDITSKEIKSYKDIQDDNVERMSKNPPYTYEQRNRLYRIK